MTMKIRSHPAHSSEHSLAHIPIQYAIAAAIFMTYGIQVCPFLDSLERQLLASIIIGLFVCMYLVRRITVKAIFTSPIKQFKLDMTIFLGGGIVLALGNYIAYDFPLVAGFRVVIGLSLLGFFISLQLLLQNEQRMITQTSASSNEPYSSVAKRIQTFIFGLLASAVVVMILVIYKDLEWLKEIGTQHSLEQAALWILYEFLFVATVFAGYSFFITRCFSQNIALYFQHQNSTLAKLKKGEREVKVPVTASNEFGTMAEYTNHMIDSLSSTEATLKDTRDAAILAIASLAETRDNETGAHILRTQEYVYALGLYLQENPRFRDELSPENLDLIYKSAPLHDIGKVGIPDSILLKPGKLTTEEFEVMKAHPVIGRRALEKAEEQVGELPFLAYAKEISEGHHEKWDGSGYPAGLKGDDIPISARLMALADVYDALITKRVYKPAFSHETSRNIIVEGKGKHFDPDIVDAFVAIEHRFLEIAERFRDG